MDRCAIDGMLRAARHASVMVQQDQTDAALQALDDMIWTLTEWTEPALSDDQLIDRMADDLGELERLADEPLAPTVKAPAWHKNVKLDGGKVVVDVFCQHLPPITLEPLEPWYRDRTVWGFWLLVALYCGLTAAL